jgi:environmental stress-induced protein Ves
MTRRTRCRHDFRQLDLAGSKKLTRAGGTTVLFLAHGDSLLCRGDDGGEARLDARDCLILDAGDPATWLLETAGPVTFYLIEIG